MLKKTLILHKNCNFSKFYVLHFLLYLGQFLSYVDPFYHFGILKVWSLSTCMLISIIKSNIFTIFEKPSLIFFGTVSSCLNLAKYDLRGQKTVQNKTPCIKKITFIGSWQNQCILSEYTYVIRIQSLGHCIPQLVFYICSCTESMACQDTQILHMSLILSPLQFYNSYKSLYFHSLKELLK